MAQVKARTPPQLPPIPKGLEQSAAVFERARKLAKAVFGGVSAGVALFQDGEVWRSGEESHIHSTPLTNLERTIADGQVLWIEDAPLDPRFCDEAVVTGPPYVRFYAAAPIKVAGSLLSGAMWVASREPRALDPELAERLQDIAEFVSDEWTRVRAQRVSEAAIQESASIQRTLSTVIESAPVRLVMTDRDLNVIAASPRWAEGRVADGESVVGRSLLDLVPTIYERWIESYRRCLAGETIHAPRVQTLKPSGEKAWMEIEITPWRDSSGEIGGIIITSHDISAMVEALERTERSQERLKLALEIADMHVWELDYQKRELTKEGAEDTFFSEPKTYEELYKDIWVTIDPRDQPATRLAWERHLNEGAPYKPEYRLVRSDGVEVWTACGIRFQTDEKGRPMRMVGAMQNITERKRNEETLVQARDEAEAATRAKSAFLATMSHEIRTPLNGVLGMAQAMAVDELNSVQRERLDVIRQSGETLLAILNDVLDLSKIEAGKLELEQVEFDLVELARGAHATFAATAEAKGLIFDLKVTSAAQGHYRGDSVRVRQILYNLVSNALKFTEHGTVTVKVSRRGETLKLTVSDTGIGIAPEKLAGLFQKFEQADASTTRRYGGTGLGLAICRDLVALMGGAIDAKSTPGEGATFTATIPLVRLAAATTRKAQERPATIAPSDGAPLRVLAAEDNGMNQLVLRTLLGQVGVEPVMVGNGRAAVEAWAAESWDLILMDVQMPEMDGPTATRTIRARERAEGRAYTPIVALTANAMSHQVAEYLAAGMDDFVAKPIEAGRLYAVIQAVLDGVNAESADVTAAA